MFNVGTAVSVSVSSADSSAFAACETSAMSGFSEGTFSGSSSFRTMVMPFSSMIIFKSLSCLSIRCWISRDPVNSKTMRILSLWRAIRTSFKSRQDAALF